MSGREFAAAIAVGGWHLTNVSEDQAPLTGFQVSFQRAGHGHAGMLVILALVGLLLAEATSLRGVFFWIARLGVPLAAILMPVGFFASAAGSGRTSASDLIVLVWLGAVALAAGVITLGVGLLRQGWGTRSATAPRPDDDPHRPHGSHGPHHDPTLRTDA